MSTTLKPVKSLMVEKKRREARPVVEWNEVEVGDLNRRPELNGESETTRSDTRSITQTWKEKVDGRLT